MRESMSIVFRYLLSLILAFPNLFIFYFIFTPLTIYPIFYFLKIFFDASLSGSIITVGESSINIIKACVAGSAYYLLSILNLTTPMSIKKRIYSIIFSFALFLAINIIRIIIFSVLFISNFSLFDLTHLLFWYFLSGLLVFLVWLATIKIFKIQNIPFYSDIKTITKKIRKY